MDAGHTRATRHEQNGALWAPGLAVGAVGAAAMAGPSLFPKNPKLFAVGTVVVAGAGLALGTGVEALARKVDAELPGDRLVAQTALAGVGLALVAGAKLATRGGRATGLLAVARSAGLVLGLGGAAGAASTLIARSDTPANADLTQAGVAAIAGAAMLCRSASLLRANRGATYLLPDLPELRLADAPLELLAEHKALGSRGLLTSGAADSAISWNQLPGQGKRFLGEMPSAAEIDRVMGTTGALDPIRVYVGLEHAPAQLSGDEAIAHRVQLAVDDLDRLGAFGRFERVDGAVRAIEPPRASIHVMSPISNGFVNPVAASSHEFMSGGDTASVAIQVATRRSATELHHVPRGAKTHAALLEAVRQRIEQIPDAAGITKPQVVAYGESYGAWTAQNAIKLRGGLPRLDQLGVDRAMWVGTPGTSPLGRELLDREVSGVRVVSDLERARAASTLPPGDRVTMLNHEADPMRHFRLRLLVEEPPWLGPAATRGRNVSSHQRFTPGVTYVQTALDLLESQFFRKGVLEARGHDYRSEISYVMRRAYGHTGISDDKVARIREWNRQIEILHAAHQAEAKGQPVSAEAAALLDR